MCGNIVLIGFMGCGKSSIGRRVAARLGFRFLDSDTLIVSRTGRNIPEIFATEGEEFFRKLEAEELQRAVDLSGIVMATGGGAILNEQNRQALHRIGTIVWLDASPDVLFERASRSHRRPLLEVEHPRTAFDNLLAARLPIYQSTCDLRVDATGFSQEQATSAVIDALSSFDR